MELSGRRGPQRFHQRNPLRSPGSTFAVGVAKERNEALTEIIFDRRVFATNLSHNIWYFFVGRYAGILAYFFPALFALLAFLATFRRRPAWQYFVVAAVVAQMLTFAIGTPYTWNGGGGSVGNRYFMQRVWPVAFSHAGPAAALAGVRALDWRRALHGAARAEPVLRVVLSRQLCEGFYPCACCPVELTLVYDWPINTDRSRSVAWFGDHPGQADVGFQIYFFDDNRYLPEEDKTFWVKGESRAEFLIKDRQADVEGGADADRRTGTH